jgi:hypothetical protein
MLRFLPGWFTSPSAKTSVQNPAEEEMADEQDPPAPQHDPAAFQKLVAQRLDAMNDARHKEEQDAKLKDPRRKLRWNIDIKPTDPAWVNQRALFRQRLMEDSVLNILERDFEEAQRLYIRPPVVNDTIWRIQTEHTAFYNACFEKPHGKFVGVPNNLATKFTMLHFGLPIAPLTINNIMNCSKDIDEDDLEDEPESLPRVQRILYAEKPLEFLDVYHDRSYGYPILRSKTSAGHVL